MSRILKIFPDRRESAGESRPVSRAILWLQAVKVFSAGIRIPSSPALPRIVRPEIRSKPGRNIPPVGMKCDLARVRTALDLRREGNADD